MIKEIDHLDSKVMDWSQKQKSLQFNFATSLFAITKEGKQFLTAFPQLYSTFSN
jgi:hypothetical protein